MAIQRDQRIHQTEQVIQEEDFTMEISVSEEVQAQLEQVKEWMESKIGREVTYNDVIMQILKNFQSVLYPEDLGSA
jgi:glycine cleavage system H lipoate-binding protein